jgi:hypothetical protein
MAAGTWLTQNKVRPGVYINFESVAKPLGSLGDRGVVTMPLLLSWGPPKQIIKIEAGADTFDVLGYGINDLLLVREALKKAKTLLLYRLNTGTKASATIGTLTATAKYGGIRGNDISITIQVNVDDPAKYDIKTLVDGNEVDAQTVSAISGLQDNDWVVFSGTGSLEAAAGVPLQGGADGTVSNQDYMDYLAAIEVQDFNTMALPSDDASSKSLIAAFIKRVRDEGKKVQAVLANYPTADYEGIISVKNGVMLSDGTVIDATQATAWVAGATAGANVNESLTYQAYDDAIDVDVRYTNTQIIDALTNGELVFVPLNGKAVIEQDINTFTSYTSEKGKQFSKNRVIRLLDGIATDFRRIFETYYIGKINNNDDGRNIFKNECVNYLTMLQNISAIQNFDSQSDITVSQGDEADSVVVDLLIQPVDSIEKIYFTIRIE